MTKEQFIKLFDKLEKIYKKDEKENKAWKEFIGVLAPTEYAPIIEGKLSTILEVLKIEHYFISDWLSYYFFEAKGMVDPMVGDSKKMYNYSKKEDIIQSMEDWGYLTK